MFRIYSPAFSDSGPIPRAHTCDGANLSPPLAWSEIPEGTTELALVADDPDAPEGTFVHWVLYGLPATISGLPAGMPRDPELKGKVTGRQGMNDFPRTGYGGPCPPPGPAHRYFFTLYALNQPLKLPAGATKSVLLDAIKKITVGEAKLMGKYGRAEKGR
ncbi:MAG: YbhB/YbcL family Raf kinase inhibitor-like protein [Gemmatimonadetes bacterium]|nr:YbhB/YbcL family Raf kinase inhibitor-like protein [Gemmatimonadota bacterium]